jgi:hypothetical protein
MILHATTCERILGEIAVMLVQTKRQNRAVHFGEKSDSGRKGSKVATVGSQSNSKDSVSICLVKPRAIQMQLNQ